VGRDALITTLREACGDTWSADAERAWREAYDALMRVIAATTT
jgi:hemoglobin-like flavoprotein